ncbi:MAG: hypothetical protein L6V81_09470 [Clostridium sp.]|nr:MAG: hypothetical protein L6V81_09470 [Clostridium sp.]
MYKLPDYPMDNFYVLSTRSKHMCYSHSTALYLHNMCDRVPLVYDVTVPYNYSGSLLKRLKCFSKICKKMNCLN